MESRLVGQDGLVREACRAASLHSRSNRVRSGSGGYIAEGLADDSSNNGTGVTDQKCGWQDTTVANDRGGGRTGTLLPAHVVQDNSCVRQIAWEVLGLARGAEGRHCGGFSGETRDDNDYATTFEPP